MNDYSHYLQHKNRVQEQETKAIQNGFAYQSTPSGYKQWVANVGTVLVQVGTTLQTFSEFELNTKFSKKNEEC